MALPVSGPISIANINTELGLAANTPISMNDTRIRTLAGKGTSGTSISLTDLYGKSNAFGYKAYIQNLFVNYYPPGTAHPSAPVTAWSSGFRIEALDQSLILRRMVGYNSAGTVLFDKTSNGVASINDNRTAADALLWHVENTEWFASAGFDNMVNRTYSISCTFYTNSTYTLYRVVVYDSNGNQYLIDRHRNFSISPISSALGTPDYKIILGTTEIAVNYP